MNTPINIIKIFQDDGDAFRRWGNLGEAERCYLKALECENGSKDHETLYRMAELFLEKKDPRIALDYYILAIHADGNNLLHKQRFLDIGGIMRFGFHNADAEDILLRCLKTPDLDLSNAGAMWLTLLRNNPEFAPLYEDPRIFEKKPDPAPLLQPYFLQGLKKISIEDTAFEDFVRRLRQWLLMGLPSLHDIPRADYLQLAEAVAAYCFHGDYIVRVTAAEQAKLLEISRRLDDPLYATVYACYALRDVQGVFAPDSTLSGILEQKTRLNIKEQPYPPSWHALPLQTLRANLFFPRRKEKLERTFAGARPELLIAGCGTGRETLMAALYYPRGMITAIDSDRNNIAYASLRAEEYDVKNISFRQDDIPTLAKISKPYDIIYSSGYLHHQPEPMKAWQILWDNLKPAGVMKIGLASRIAWHAAVTAREVIRKYKINDNRESILDFRARSAELLPPDTLESLSALPGYYNFSAYKNLLFHPHMHFFTLPEIEEMLAKLRLAFEGFDLPATVLQRYAEKFPDDPEMVSLKNWHLFEQEAPYTFIGLYQFWCRKI